MLNDYNETSEQAQACFKREVSNVMDSNAKSLIDLVVGHARGVDSMMHAARIVEPYNAEAALGQIGATIQHLKNISYWAKTAAEVMEKECERERKKPAQAKAG